VQVRIQVVKKESKKGQRGGEKGRGKTKKRERSSAKKALSSRLF